MHQNFICGKNVVDILSVTISLVLNVLIVLIWCALGYNIHISNFWVNILSENRTSLSHSFSKHSNRISTTHTGVNLGLGECKLNTSFMHFCTIGCLLNDG